MLIRLATRASALAQAQSTLVATMLEQAGRARGMDISVDLVTITSDGDRMFGSLVGLSQTGVFVSAVRQAVLDGEADVAVHSLKDAPVDPHPELTVAAIPRRADARDVWCSTGATLAEIDAGARVGTSSPRRAAQVLAARPEVEVRDIRGNVDTRLATLGEGYDAVVLAAAGLDRLGLQDAVVERFDIDQMVPAPGQGALLVEIAHDAPASLAALVATLNDPHTAACVTAERAVLATLMAGCATPVGAYAHVDGELLRLLARVVRPDGTLQLTETSSGPVTEAASLGRHVGYALLARGAARFME